MPPRFSFLPPSVGDSLLARATSCKLEFHRWPAELSAEADGPLADTPFQTELQFELKGELPLAGHAAAELLAAIAHEFTRPPRGGKGGGQ